MLFQLAVKGRFASFDGSFRANSKRVFSSREAAEAHIPDFIRRCTDDTLFSMDATQPYKTYILTLVLDQEEDLDDPLLGA